MNGFCNLMLKIIDKLCYNASKINNEKEIKMYSVLDIARYIINYSNTMNYSISNLKLQKLLYFAQAYFYIKKNKPCFKEKIEAWDYGPVVPIVYKEYKKFGSSSIARINDYLVCDEKTWKIKQVKVTGNEICDNDKAYINEVIEHFSRFTASDLVRITHKQKPWKKVYSEYVNNEITKESIKEYFCDGESNE